MIICVFNLLHIIGEALLSMIIVLPWRSNNNKEKYSHLIVVDDCVRVTVTGRTGKIQTPDPSPLMKRSSTFPYVCTIHGQVWGSTQPIPNVEIGVRQNFFHAGQYTYVHGMNRSTVPPNKEATVRNRRRHIFWLYNTIWYTFRAAKVWRTRDRDKACNLASTLSFLYAKRGSSMAVQRTGWIWRPIITRIVDQNVLFLNTVQ